MKILFVYASENGCKNEFQDFMLDYIAELKKHCEVICILFSFGIGTEADISGIFDYIFICGSKNKILHAELRLQEELLELRRQTDFIFRSFKPDIIHCSGKYAYLPFRFDKNVFYSTSFAFEDCLNYCIQDEFYFRSIQAERLALMNSTISAVYSDSAAENAKKLCGGMCSPIVIPCGVPRTKSNVGIQNRLDSIYGGRKLCVSFFGSFENSSDGAANFIFAVNKLGRNFKRAHNIKYCLFGRGSINSAVSLELFDEITEESEDAFLQSDITVLPRSRDFLGYTALKAMSNSSLVMLTHSGAENVAPEMSCSCIEIPKDMTGISKSILDAVINFRSYSLVAENAHRTASYMNIERTVLFTMYIYKRICEGRASEVSTAYDKEERNIIKKFRDSHDAEKIFNGDLEYLTALELIKIFYKPDKKILLLTGACDIENYELPKNISAYSVLYETSNGITLRPECLPFQSCSYDTVIVAGAWEAIVNPCSALMELQRIANKNIAIIYNKGIPRSWQNLRMCGSSDWAKINTSAFYCSEKDEKYGILHKSGKNYERDLQNAELKRKIDKVIKRLSGKSTLGAVIYSSRRIKQDEKTA